MKKPIHRSTLRLSLGTIYYGLLRKFLWLRMKSLFASTIQSDVLPFTYASHRSILLRKLQDVDMWLQYNKIINLKIAIKQVNGIIIRPGEIFSYWKLIGKPTKVKGYVKGMVLNNGSVCTGTGGGLCQLSNLIFWLTIHTPLTIIERHRHGYDVFPDVNRSQPFGSGATCFYPHGDLMIQNNTEDTFQLKLTIDQHHLIGEWLVSSKPKYRYQIEERNHQMKSEYWGGYTRYNELFQLKYDEYDNFLDEKIIVRNEAIMKYSPYIAEKI